MGLLNELSDAFESPERPATDTTPIDAEAQSARQQREAPRAPANRDFDALNDEASARDLERRSRTGRRPFVTTSPDSSRLSIPAGTHAAPGRKALEDQIRLTRLNASSRGALFQLQQGTLQARNARRLTRVYDPSAGQRSATSLLVSEKRHAESSDRIVSRVAGQAGDVLGIDAEAPRSADREEEIRALTDGEGYLVNQTPAVSTTSVGAAFRRAARASVRSRLPNLAPDRFSMVPGGQQALRVELQRVDEGAYDQAVGTARWVDADGRTRFNRYNPTFPRTSRDGDVPTPDGEPNISRPVQGAGGQPEGLYDTVTERAVRDRESAREAFERFRLGGEAPYATSVPPADATTYSAEESVEDLFRENRVETGPDAGPGEQYIMHRRPSRFNQTTHGLPNHSVEGLTEDAVNALPVQPYDPSQPEETVFTENGEEFRQIVDFRVYDIVNRNRLVFRAYLEGLSLSNNIEYSSKRYIGRPEQYHIYGGNSRSVSFSFKVFAESERTFEAMWEKVNYLEGLAYPSSYAALPGGGAYMVAPFTQLTLGSVMRRQPGFIESLDIEVADEYPWSTRTGAQLTKGVNISVGYTVIESRLPSTGQRFFDADFIDEQ